jgi:hypothetical protein
MKPDDACCMLWRLAICFSALPNTIPLFLHGTHEMVFLRLTASREEKRSVDVVTRPGCGGLKIRPVCSLGIRLILSQPNHQ